MTADKAPLLFEARLGGLFPANAAAETVMRDIKGRVRIDVKAGVANQRRRSLYWSVIALCVPLLNDKNGLTLDDQDLHDILREKLRLYDEHVLPSGEVHRKLRSTSNRAMNEHDRAKFTDDALRILGTWLGVDPTTLRNEAETN